jgi:hypothetical protein
VHPNGVEVTFTKNSADVSIEGTKECRGLAIDGIAKDRQEFMFVAGKQVSVPLDADAKLVVEVAAYRNVTCEEDFKVNVRLACNATQQGRLVLDWMCDKVGKAKRVLLGKPRG